MSLVMHSPTAAPVSEARCAVCFEASRRAFSLANYWIRECESCGHQFAEINVNDRHVEEIYGDDYFSGGKEYADYLGSQRGLLQRGRWYASRIAPFCKPGALLDVGTAAGFTLRAFADAGWRVFGLEPNAGMAEHARTKLNVEVVASALESWDSAQRFDLISMLQVLPHFVDPRAAIRKAGACLRPGGHLLIETWDRKSWTSRLFGKGWHAYNPPSVLHWFSKGSATRLMAEVGFEYVAGGRPSKWIDAAHAKAILRSKAKESVLNQLLFNLSWPVPDRAWIPYYADDLFWALYRRARSPGPLGRQIRCN